MLLLENKDFREFVGLLNSRGVEFLIVGGHAVGLHGHPRFTGDLDIWVATDSGNAKRVAPVLKDFGFHSLKFTARDFERPGYAIQLGRPPYRIDILTSIDAVEFAAAWKRRKLVNAGGLELAFIGLRELLVNKRATGRPLDLDGAEKLEAGIHRKAGKARTKRSRRRTKQ